MQTFEFEYKGTMRRFAISDSGDLCTVEMKRGDGNWVYLGFFNEPDERAGIRALLRRDEERQSVFDEVMILANDLALGNHGIALESGGNFTKLNALAARWNAANGAAKEEL